MRTVLAALFKSILTAEIHTAALIDAGDLDPCVITYVENIFNFLGALELKIRTTLP